MDESLVARYPDLERSHFWWNVRRVLVERLVSGLQIHLPRILDVGCGSGLTARMLADSGANVVGVDIEPRDSSGDAERVRFLTGDFIDLSSQAGEFDVVLALDAVEHFESEQEVLNAMFKNTRPGGVVIMTVPSYSWLWSSHDEENHHFRRYSRQRLRSALQEAGFAVERVGYVFAALLLPKAIIALIEQRRARPVEISATPSPGWNSVARSYFWAETALALRLRNFLPFGTSVIAVARRPDEQS